MKRTGYIFIMMFICVFPLIGQMQYTSVPRSGEGRFDRTDKAAFWMNPIFLKPSVFFSSSEISLRTNRKWWRKESRILPQPYTAHGYLPEDFSPIDPRLVENRQGQSTLEKLHLNPDLQLLKERFRRGNTNIHLINGTNLSGINYQCLAGC